MTHRSRYSQMAEKRSGKAHQKSDPETWVDQYGDYLYGYALSRIKDPSVAEDLVQETFVAALKTYKNFEGHSSERTWLTSILRHKAVDYFRRTSREKPMEDVDASTEFMNEYFDGKGQWRASPASWTLNPREILERKDFWKTLTDCLSGLSENLAIVFRLREMDGLSTEEICKVLKITPTNCWVILHRARMGMRRCLEMNWFET